MNDDGDDKIRINNTTKNATISVFTYHNGQEVSTKNIKYVYKFQPKTLNTNTSFLTFMVQKHFTYI